MQNMNNSPYSFWNPCAESDRCCIVQLHAIPREHEVQCFVTRPPGPPYSISIYARFSGIARYFTIVLRLFRTIKTINNKKTEKDWKAGKLEGGETGNGTSAELVLPRRFHHVLLVLCLCRCALCIGERVAILCCA